MRRSVRLSVKMVDRDGSSIVAVQLALYTDDVVEAVYSDGSRLQLSACGATFLHRQQPQSHDHALQAVATVQQRSRFVTSSFREKLKTALDFRNMFASHPYLCDVSLDAGDTVRLYTDIVEVAWPVSPTGHLDSLLDHSLRLTSVDEWAQVILAPSSQYFTVKYLCALDETVAWQPTEMDSRDHSAPRSGDVAANMTRQCRTYVWIVQHHSVVDYPDHWRHPVELLLSNVSMATHLDENSSEVNKCSASRSSTDNAGKENLASGNKDSLDVCLSLVEDRNTHKLIPCVVTRVPQALPLNCSSQQLHRWTTDNTALPSGGTGVYYGGRLKVVCSHGVIYRLLRSVPSTVEVYPGDDSVLRSTGMTATFFQHFICKNGKVEERMYSVDSPPPHVPGLPYSISKLIATATSFIRQVDSENLQLLPPEDAVCWKTKQVDLATPLASVLLEECDIPAVGRFTAHSSGHVRVVFPDRTCLDMFADFQHRLSMCRKHSETEVPTMTSEWTELPKGVCRLLLPTGHYHMVQMDSPGQYLKYITAATDWAGWVNSSPSERYRYYKDSPYDPSKRASVDCELKKIRCFNYILESEHAHHTHHNTHTVAMATSDRCTQGQEVNFDVIHDVLRKTSAAVQDLDQFLTLTRETGQVNH